MVDDIHLCGRGNAAAQRPATGRQSQTAHGSTAPAWATASGKVPHREQRNRIAARQKAETASALQDIADQHEGIRMMRSTAG
jgi:hypothetical protein